MKKLRTNINEKWVDENNILHIKYIEGAVVDMPAIKKSTEENQALLNGKKEFVLCDARAFFTVTPDAQKYAHHEIMNKTRVATAVVSNKGFVRLLVNFAIQFSKLRSSVKMFSNEKQALKWLYELKSG
ncbi:MAG: hypothetical protein HY841_01025 [Bacteroidetes bacterium]|nr:hypothetical protein [Bacteroidota bacterium]